MPELPEVETVKNALRTHLLAHCLVKTEIFIDKLRYSLTPLLDECLCHHTIIDVRRRGRYIIIELDNLMGFIIHLGMSGSLRIVEQGELRHKHEHVVWLLDNGMTMRFDCPRRFGFVKKCSFLTKGAEPEELSHLGMEPLHEGFDGDTFFELTRGRSGSIKNFIMNNSVVVGVGNIYATESLFEAAILPTRSAKSITKHESHKLVTSIKDTLHEAIKMGGTTIADYKSVDGSEGKFVQKLRVYGRSGGECFKCGTIIKKVVLGGRSSSFCPNCQK